jgi:hypothetical protein
MKWLVCTIGLVLIGCNSTPQPPSEPTIAVDRNRSSVRTPEKMPAPAFDKKTSLKLVRNGAEIHVGDSIDDALNAFKPDKNAQKLADMPPGWRDSTYRCAGWDSGNVGFGAITLDERVVLALYHEDRSTEGRLKEILDDYDRAIPIPATQINGQRVRYWFWDQEPHRLMICAVQPPNEGLNITVALGDAGTMNYFGMNSTLADKDRAVAEELFQQGIERKTASKNSQ